MRILQTGDLHLGKVLHEYSLLDDQKDMLDQLLSALGEGYDALIIAGDVYDRSVPPPEAVELFDQFLTTARSRFPATHIFIIPGNHDSSRRLGFASHLLEASNIHIASERAAHDYLLGKTKPFPGAVTLTDAEGFSARFYAIPFLSALDTQKAVLQIAAEIAGAENETAPGEAHAPATPQSPTPPQKPAAICISHCLTLGAVQSDSERIIIGTQENLSTSLFAPFTYTALGHIHKPQKVGDTVYYSGSPLAYSFSEAGQEKHFLSVTVSAGTETPAGAPKTEKSSQNDESTSKSTSTSTGSVNVVTVEEIPVRPLHPLASICDTFRNIETDPRYDAVKDNYLEIRCTDTVIAENPVARLKDRFPHLMVFRRELAGADGGNSATGDGTDGGAALPTQTNESLEKRKALLDGNENGASLRDVAAQFLSDVGENADSWQTEIALLETLAKEVENETH